MKKLLMVIVACVLCLPVLAMAQDEGYYSRSYARVSYVSGDVFVQRAGNLGYETGVINLAMAEGDKLGTREGRVEIQFGGRNYLRADRSTQVEFAKLPRQDNDPYKLHLLSGEIFLRVGSLDREKAFEVHSPDGSFYILAEGLYRFSLADNRETELQVIEGSCEAAGESGSVVVKAGERLVAADGNLRSDRGSLTAANDDFSRWNDSRDSLQAQSLSRSASQSYLPPELDEYGSEFDQNGTWNYEPTYGNVWVPRVTDNDWRPYYYGHWVWYPIIGWTWVSDEPWGWCAYHYGRWQWDLGLGWFWTPTRFWGPAWVNWWSDYDYIGWCPLNYYNRPGVFRNNRYYSHNNRDHYPLDSRALTVVRKNQLQAGRISDVALRRSELGHISQVDLSARQPGVAPSIDRAGHAFSEGQRVFSQAGIRQVNRSFGSGGTNSGSLGRVSSGSAIRDRGGLIREGLSSRSTSSSRQSGTADRGAMIRETQGARNIRSYPSGGGSAFESHGSISSSSGSRNSGSSSSSIRSDSSSNSSRTYHRDSSSSSRVYDNSRTIREFQPSPSTSRSRYSSTFGSESLSRAATPRTFDSRSSSGSNFSSRAGASVPDFLRSRGTITERSSRYSGSSSRSSFGSSFSAPGESRSYSYPRSYSSTSRSYSSQPHSYSSPSYGSYGSSSRSYSAPSRGYSSPSYGSYGSSSHSYSAPSRSYSSSSRSSGSSSHSSSSGSSYSHSSSSHSSSSSSSGSRRHGR